MELISFGRWVKRTLGLDRAIVYTILARVWSSASGIVTVLLIARFLSPAEQGYYYTFGSLVALQFVFELGFSVVILQLASHERAHLTLVSDGTVSGDRVAHERIASVLQKAVRWYFTGGLLMAAVLIPLGFYFFSTHQHVGPSLSWQIPWVLVVLAATLTFQIDPVLSFLEGCGFVANVARLRLAQAILSGALAWLVLVIGHGMYAPAMMIFGQGIAGFLWLYRQRPLLMGLLRHKTGPNRIEWKSEVWPFQWRIAVTWICAYFVSQLFNPVLFAYRGAVEAGRMGMSLSIMGALTSVSIAWVNTKAAPFGTLIARKEYEALDRIFFTSLRRCMFICAAGSLCVWLGAMYLNAAHLRFAQRLLDPLTLGILLLATMINVLMFALSIYFRAHKQEKMLGSSILSAILVSFSTYFLGRHFGARGMAIGYFAVAVCVGLGYNISIFTRYRRDSHQ
jgi:hypothetical protein